MEDRPPQSNYSVSLKKQVTSMKPQVKSEAEASLIILDADQESAIWFIG